MVSEARTRGRGEGVSGVGPSVRSESSKRPRRITAVAGDFRRRPRGRQWQTNWQKKLPTIIINLTVLYLQWQTLLLLVNITAAQLLGGLRHNTEADLWTLNDD